MRAIRIDEFGGPSVLKLVEMPIPVPGDGEVLIEVARCGVNFADTHQRRDSYVKKAELPYVPGVEVSGRVASDAPGFRRGDRVAATLGEGGYAQYAAAAADTTFPVPDGVDDDTAAALPIQGLTAWHVLRTQAHLRVGESVVVHAAGGGVGHLAVQIAKLLGAGRVIGTATTEERRRLAVELGADAAVDPRREDLGEALCAANLGRPVDVVIEMSGGRVFEESLAALAPLGRIVVCGIAGGESNRVSSGRLLRASAAVIGFWIFHALDRRELTEPAWKELLGWVASGRVRTLTGGVYPLADARLAHEEMQARRTRGKLLLDPRVEGDGE